jgi:hypothetical protein
MNGIFQMPGGKNRILPKEMNANRFFWDSHWLEIWSNHFFPSMGPNGGSVAMDSEGGYLGHRSINLNFFPQQRYSRKISLPSAKLMFVPSTFQPPVQISSIFGP